MTADNWTQDPECHGPVLCPQAIRSQVCRGPIPDRSRRSDDAPAKPIGKLGHFLWFFLQRRPWLHYPGIRGERRPKNAFPGDTATNDGRGDFSLLEKPDHGATGFGQNPSVDECRPAHEEYHSRVSASPVISLGGGSTDLLQYSPGHQTCQHSLDAGLFKFTL